MLRRTLVEEPETGPLPLGAAIENRSLREMESRGRSLMKAMSWRVFAFIITFSLVWIVTGEARFAIGVGILDTLLKICLYYWHERAWNRFNFGRRRHQNLDMNGEE